MHIVEQYFYVGILQAAAVWIELDFESQGIFWHSVLNPFYTGKIFLSPILFIGFSGKCKKKNKVIQNLITQVMGQV